ncbi:hypothetical protein EPA93_28955 [Ktedonosporobacter rubrisoli]|uniref:DUF3592 domain-containing protein n=1 Tax=Ktedonosporobacter rubrisoli TaxID=2509675 RepID=A0A4V0YZI0_KTERU|nr:DUF3592 domain-containing protein [Ktedonosporobacter rubrisoli]QBD79791.1 hypothetical protein EPA93_28955 [Ktedonosporobacter rubrisoli]
MLSENMLILLTFILCVLFFGGLGLWVFLVSSQRKRHRECLQREGERVMATILRVQKSTPTPLKKSAWHKVLRVIEAIFEFLGALGGQLAVASTAGADTYYLIVAEWLDPQTKQRYEFISEGLSMPLARRYKAGQQIPVFIARQRPERYWVDVTYRQGKHAQRACSA